MLEVRPTALAGVLEIRPRLIADDRGFFSEVWSEAAFAGAGIDLRFIQDNHSLSREAGVLRGLHFQAPPFAQDKLVRVSRGAVFDVAVDIRSASPTFGQWVGLRLSAADWNQMLIPKGFAHGFLALEPGCEVQYKVTAPYSREHDRAIRFDDPAIGIDWPIDRAALILSDKDRAAPLLADIDTGF
jgi:dTDP-4-dehydrorhamnose 3,5-epimerase